MPTNLTLKFTPEAKTDMFDIFEYISEELSAPTTATNLIDKIERACQRLTLFPLSCPIPRDGTLAKKGYRMLVVDNFIVFYKVDDVSVIMMRILYGKRNYKNLL